MTAQKIVHYQVAVSPRYPSTHPRKGEPTYFVEKIQLALNLLVQVPGDILIDLEPKIHTCRKNYPLWVKRMKKVNEGRAVIDLYYWKLKGGRFTEGNEKVVFATLDNTSGCGVQELYFKTEIKYPILYPFVNNVENEEILLNVSCLAENDGLSLKDFEWWFKGYDLSKSLAIVHFTKFRY